MGGGVARHIPATTANAARVTDTLTSFESQKHAILSCDELGLEYFHTNFDKVYDTCLPRLTGSECHRCEFRVPHGGHTGGAHAEIRSKLAAGTAPL